LIVQAEDERRRARTAPDKAGRDRHVMRAERLLDQAWELNEARDDLPPLESGLWGSSTEPRRRAA
jgi:hypothetical protein